MSITYPTPVQKLSVLEKQDPRSASVQKHAAKPGLAMHCSKMRSSEQGFQVVLHFVLNNAFIKLVDVLPHAFLSVLCGHWSWSMQIGMGIY